MKGVWWKEPNSVVISYPISSDEDEEGTIWVLDSHITVEVYHEQYLSDNLCQ